MNRWWFLIIFILLVVGCLPTEETGTCSPPECIVFGLTLSPSGIDPHINQSSELGVVLRQVYDTLVYRDPETKEFVGGLASSWVISPDGLIYTFSLKRGVTFHDGTAFNADAVGENIDRILAPEINSQRAKLLLGTLSGYEVVDEFTIKFILNSPYSPLLDSLSQVYLGIASPAALAKYKDDPIRYQFHQVGTGPFRFIEYLPEDRIVIERSTNYSWGPEFYGEKPLNAISRVVFRFFRDAPTRLIALENGTAHIMGELLPSDARSVTNNSNIRLYPTAIAGQPLQFYFNTQIAPTNSLEVRQALLYALNRKLIVEAVYQGFSPIAWSAISSPTAYYSSLLEGVYDYNLQQAQTLLANAGYQDSNGDGVLDRDGVPLTLTVIQPPWGLVPQVTQLMQSQWREIGVNLIIEPVAGFTTLIEKVNEGDYNLVSFDTFGVDPSFLNARFMSNGSVNWTGYQDSTLDEWLSNAAQTTENSTRESFYALAQERIMSQALIIPIREYVNVNASVTSVSGLIYDPYGWFPLLYGVTYQE